MSGVVKLTSEQISLLQVLALRPRVAILRGEDEKRIANSLLHTGFIRDMYEMPGGGLSAGITPAGRAALTSTQDGRKNNQ